MQMKIALISDTHFASVAKDFVANGRAACAWVDEIGADLTVHLGDITADGVIAPEHFSTASEVLSALKTPLKLLPGNHDVGDNPRPAASPVREPILNAEALALYRRTFGADHWSFQEGAWTALGLNAQLFGLGDLEEATQLAWLDQALASARGPIGLMLHKPLFRTAPDDGDAHHRYIPPRSRPALFKLLEGKDLRFVVSGHTHQARRYMYAGVEHVWAPSTAFTIPDRLQERIGEKTVGVMTLHLEPDGHRFEIFRPIGVNQHDLGDYADVYPRLAQAGRSIADE